MDYDGFLQMVMKRRSIRQFKPDPIPDDYVDKIIEAARWAPSGANSQPWEFVVVTDKEVKGKIVDSIKEGMAISRKLGQTRPPEDRHPGDNRKGDNPGFQDAPVFIILFGDKRLNATYPLSAYLNSRDSIFVSGLASTFLYMHLAVTSLGLASQWVSASSNILPQALIKQILGVPGDRTLYDMMALGYGLKEPRSRIVRSKDEITHYNHYDISKNRTNEEVTEFIRHVHGVRATMSD